MTDPDFLNIFYRNGKKSRILPEPTSSTAPGGGNHPGHYDHLDLKLCLGNSLRAHETVGFLGDMDQSSSKEVLLLPQH